MSNVWGKLYALCNIRSNSRSWIEYLNERYKVYILDRSINLDNNTDRSVKWTINIQIWYTFVIKQIETNTSRVLHPIEKSIHKNNYLQSWSGSKTRLNAVVSKVVSIQVRNITETQWLSTHRRLHIDNEINKKLTKSDAVSEKMMLTSLFYF